MEKIDQKLVNNETEKDQKEDAFTAEIVSRLTSNFTKELTGLGYGPEDLAQFAVDVYNNQDKDQLSRLFAIPKELRTNLFTKNKLAGTNLPIIQVLDNYYESFVLANNGESPKIGFHTSDQEITPQTDRNGKTAWNIKGTEVSDLSDGKQAYAADNYKSIYRTKAPRWLYLVRLMDEQKRYGAAEETSWHHNNNFAVIDKFELSDIDQAVESRIKNQNDSQINTQQAA